MGGVEDREELAHQEQELGASLCYPADASVPTGGGAAGNGG